MEEDRRRKARICYDHQSDEEFRAWILQELVAEAPRLYNDYGDVFEKISYCITSWRKRYRGNAPLWNRLFKPDRVVKEAIESIPVIRAVDLWISCQHDEQPPVTVIDLCSGKGYLSMLLSEYLPPSRVTKCVLIDKAWPLCHSAPKPHHISWEHIYGDTTNENGPRYYETWPIPLVTSKQDLKQSLTLRQLEKRFSGDGNGNPVLILAVHLCGTLSIQGIKLFRSLPNAKVLILKPCCLPGIYYEKRQKCFEIGNYSFPTSEVCASGKWRTNKKTEGKRWKGPPRWHLERRFHRWCHHLHEGLSSSQNKNNDDDDKNESKSKDDDNDDDDDEPGTSIRTSISRIPVQTRGGYQNTFLFAEKHPIPNPSRMWEEIMISSGQQENDVDGETTTTAGESNT